MEPEFFDVLRRAYFPSHHIMYSSLCRRNMIRKKNNQMKNDRICHAKHTFFANDERTPLTGNLLLDYFPAFENNELEEKVFF